MYRNLALSLMIAALSLPGAAMAKGPKHCPPGLAKKTPACVPPGQAKKGARYDDDRYDRDHVRDRGDRYTDDRYDDDDWYGDRYDRIRVGDRVILEGEEYTVVRVDDGRVVLRRDDTIYRLPRVRDGWEYVRMGDVIVKVDPKTRAIVEWIRLTDLIFG